MLNDEVLYFFTPFFHFNLVGCILGEVHDVAHFYVDRASRSVFEDFSCADSDDFAFMRFFFALGKNDSAFCCVFLRERFDENVVF